MVKSNKPGKQRKSADKAPLHLKRKRVRSRLQSDDPRLAAVRSVTVRVGDQVRVIRGDFAHGGKRHGGKRKIAAQDKKAHKVIRIDSHKGRLFIEGQVVSTSDNKDEAVSVHASNVVVVKLDETDPLRMKKLTADRS